MGFIKPILDKKREDLNFFSFCSLINRDMLNFNNFLPFSVFSIYAVCIFLQRFLNELCPGGAPGQTYGCIRSAVGWGCIPPLPPVGMGRGESAAPEFTS